MASQGQIPRSQIVQAFAHLGIETRDAVDGQLTTNRLVMVYQARNADGELVDGYYQLYWDITPPRQPRSINEVANRGTGGVEA